jgi:hypothetical protein
VVTSYDVRTRWDSRFVGAHVFETFAGAGEAHAVFAVNKASFPFHDRGFYLFCVIGIVPSLQRQPAFSITHPRSRVYLPSSTLIHAHIACLLPS